MNVERLSDQELLALCIWGEARGESITGQLAIAHVVLNRAERQGWFGATVREVILKPYQFSFFNEIAVLTQWPSVAQLAPMQMVIAELALGKLTLDPSLGATHYHATWLTPRWAPTMRHLVDIGKHRFYVER